MGVISAAQLGVRAPSIVALATKWVVDPECSIEAASRGVRSLVGIKTGRYYLDLGFFRRTEEPDKGKPDPQILNFPKSPQATPGKGMSLVCGLRRGFVYLASGVCSVEATLQDIEVITDRCNDPVYVVLGRVHFIGEEIKRLRGSPADRIFQLPDGTTPPKFEPLFTC
jgi:hypothetical protein